VVGGGVTQVLAGLLLAALPAFFISRLLEHLLFGLQATDLMTYSAVATILLVVGAGAAAIPGARATRIDPNTSIRDA
ncbi:MAG: hypothetical protein AAGE94_20395, partial [Acidobacteriota bacterium]